MTSDVGDEGGSKTVILSCGRQTRKTCVARPLTHTDRYRGVSMSHLAPNISSLLLGRIHSAPLQEGINPAWAGVIHRSKVKMIWIKFHWPSMVVIRKLSDEVRPLRWKIKKRTSKATWLYPSTKANVVVGDALNRHRAYVAARSTISGQLCLTSHGYEILLRSVPSSGLHHAFSGVFPKKPATSVFVPPKMPGLSGASPSILSPVSRSYVTNIRFL